MFLEYHVATLDWMLVTPPRREDFHAHIQQYFELFLLHSGRIPLGLVGLIRQSSADGSNGRASGWRECLMAALERVIHRFTHAC